MSTSYAGSNFKMKMIRLFRIGSGVLVACLMFTQNAALASWEEGVDAFKRRDFVVAFGEFKRLAEQGHVEAQNKLGLMYLEGFGVRKSLHQYFYWTRRAATQGYAKSQTDLGALYYQGTSGIVDRDPIKAYFWLVLAESQGEVPAAWIREAVERELSVSQRVEILEAARSWAPQMEGNAPLGRGTVSPDSPRTLRIHSTGSGFSLNRTNIVTNAHVISECTQIKVGGRGTATVLTTDTRIDLAVLSVTSAPTFGSLRAGRLRQGDAITVVGYPLRGVLASGAQVTAGNVSALAGMQNDSRFIQISAPVQPGNSGGPLVDSSGNVVGVVVSKLNAVKMAQLTGDIPQNVNFAVSPLTLQGFLDANGVDYQTAPSNKNLSTADVADIAKKYTVLVECWK